MLTTKNSIDFKQVNKNLKIELSKLNFSISNQACLNLLSKALGYANYNTYKSLLENKEDVNFGFEKYALKKIDFEQMERDRILSYPPIKNKNFSISNLKFKDFDILVDYEDDTPYLLFSEKNSITDRVYYAPKYNMFCFFIYPTVLDGLNDYHIEISIDKLNNNFLDTMLHLGRKNWWNTDFMDDFLELLMSVRVNYKEIKLMKI